MASLHILDVGHGNCAVIVDRHTAIVIDAGLGDTLLQFIEERQVTVIEAVLISHADKDHIGGLIGLLSGTDIPIRNLFINPDRARRTQIWEDVISLVESRTNRDLQLHLELTSRHPANLRLGTLRVEILSPSQAWAVRALDQEHRVLGPNSLSAVVRLVQNDMPVVLLGGDMDGLVLEEWIRTSQQAAAEILIFPHHGGRPGRADAQEFTQKLCRLVSPRFVIFSIGRGQHQTPRPEIIDAVRTALPEARILCTQLSENCAARIPNTRFAHLSADIAQGKSKKACCAGTISVELGESTLVLTPDIQDHSQWLKAYVHDALCTK